jgi:MATE family multidrug resistance protein
MRIGGHLLLRTGALVGTMTLATAVAARVGVMAVAAHQVANQLWGFLALVVDALAVAAQALVAKHLGSGEADEAREVANRLLQWGLGVGLVLAVGFFALRPILPLLFTDDPDTIAAVMDIFIFVAILQPINGVVFVWDGVYMGAERFGFLAKAMAISATGAVVVLLLVRPMGWGLEGVWWGITALMLVRVVTLGWPYVRGRVFRGASDEGE